MSRRAREDRLRGGAVLLGLVAWSAGCAPRLSGDALVYDSGVVIADADQTHRDASSGDAGPADGEPLDAAIPDVAPGRVPNWTDDIQPIMARHCNTCHGPTPAGGATFGLSTYAQVLEEMVSMRTQETDYRYVFMARAVASAMAPMPPEFVMNPLVAADVEAMIAWAAAGAPEDVADTDGGTAPPDARVAAPEDGGLPDAPAAFPDAQVFPDAAPPPTNPLVGVGTVDQVAGGLVFTEGPLWVPVLDVLLFSDVGGNRMHRITPPNTVDVFREPSAVANGLALDPAARLVIAEHESRSVTRMSTAGGPATAIATTYRGLRFNSPNDVTVRSDGVVYFSDPPYGLGMRTRELPFNGLFRLVEVPTSTIVAEWEGALTTAPNGVILRDDERVLYMADTTGNLIMAFDVAVADGDLSNPRVHVRTANSPDGMAIDANGNLFVATTAGVQAFAPDGQLWGAIAVPRTPSNIAWGDPDRRTLYITATSLVYRVRLVTPGVRD